jgi:hypothetical protein
LFGICPSYNFAVFGNFSREERMATFGGKTVTRRASSVKKPTKKERQAASPVGSGNRFASGKTRVSPKSKPPDINTVKKRQAYQPNKAGWKGMPITSTGRESGGQVGGAMGTGATWKPETKPPKKKKKKKGTGRDE